MAKSHQLNCKTVALVHTHAATLMKFRGPLVRELLRRNMRVVLLSPGFLSDEREQLGGLGVVTLEFTFDSASLNPLCELRTLLSLLAGLKRAGADVLVTFQHKANVYGAIGAALCGVPRTAAVVEGLGLPFTEAGGTLAIRLARGVLKILYRLSFALADRVIFLNQDDLEDCVRLGLLKREKGVVLGGIGVLLDQWQPEPPRLEPLTFTLVTRLLKEKGVVEFAQSAARLKSRYRNVRFLLIGPLSPHPGSVAETEVVGWVTQGILDWVPWAEDVRPYLRETSVYVYPSYYREGVPRSVQEAMAMARPVITTWTPGCKETVEHGVNGFLVPPRDAIALADAMECFIQEPQLLIHMGAESRRLAEQRFDARKQAERLLQAVLG